MDSNPSEASAALMRIPHMVHLYRRRAMFPLPAPAVVSWSLTVALQLMLFPDTPTDVLRVVTPQDVGQAQSPALMHAQRPGPTPEVVKTPRSPIAEDVLSVSSALFAEYGYYAVGMEEIAAAADLSRATLYRYFSTKDRILAELTLRAVSEIEEHAAALPRMGIGALTEWMVSYVRFDRAYRGVIRAWFDGTVAERLSDSVVHGMGAIHRAVSAVAGDRQTADRHSCRSRQCGIPGGVGPDDRTDGGGRPRQRRGCRTADGESGPTLAAGDRVSAQARPWKCSGP